MLKRRLLFLFFVLIFFFIFSSVNAAYKTSEFKGDCTNTSIPSSASSIYDVDDGVFNLSGTTYGNYKKMHSSDTSEKGYSNYLLDNTFVYFSTSKDKKP